MIIQKHTNLFSDDASNHVRTVFGVDEKHIIARFMNRKKVFAIFQRSLTDMDGSTVTPLASSFLIVKF